MRMHFRKINIFVAAIIYEIYNKIFQIYGSSLVSRPIPTNVARNLMLHVPSALMYNINP